MASSLPAVRCRSDEAAWSNLYGILSHKATRLGGTGRGVGGSVGSGSVGMGGGSKAGSWGGSSGVGTPASGISPVNSGSGGVGGIGGGNGGRKAVKDFDLPPWVAAVLWASLHALPKVCSVVAVRCYA